MERTLAILKPCCIERSLVGEVVKRIEQKGIVICGMKMMQLDEKILREHYAHLVDRPFFPAIVETMTTCPVIVMCLEGIEAVRVFREMTGATNGRKANPGTLRGDFCISGSQNIVHASDSLENAEIEIKRFFRPEELFDYKIGSFAYLYAPDEV